jgi:Uma2 family endonuclease
MLAVIQSSYPNYDLEIRNGEYVIVAPHDAMSSRLVVKICARIETWISATKLGYVFESNGGFMFSDGDLMAPDVSFISKVRVPVVPRSFVNAIPELVFEIRSSTQSERATRAKLALLLAQGVDVAVYVDPGQHIVEIHRAGAAPQSVAKGERVEFPDVLPGFSFAVDELWVD